MKEPFPRYKPNKINIDVVDNNVLLISQSKGIPDVNFILEKFDKIKSDDKSLAAQFLVSNGVDIELIPEYRQEEYLYDSEIKIRYKCGCFETVYSNNCSFEKPEGFEKDSEVGTWDYIRYYGKKIITEEYRDELCPNCSLFSPTGILEFIKKYENGYLASVTVNNKTYIAIEDVTYDAKHFYSGAIPKKVINSRFIFELDHSNLSMKIVKKLRPRGKIKALKAIIDYCLQIEDLLKSNDIDFVIKNKVLAQ